MNLRSQERSEMICSWRGWGRKLELANFLAIGGAIIFADCVFAQSKIIPDTTLGANERSLLKTNVEIKGLPGERIDGGAQRGTNLFHSFQEFNVGESQRVYFTDPAGVENILSRVIGNDPSNILGTLGVTGGDANLFLMNPNGIFFGPNASLDVNGSFMATTANAIQLGNSGQFSASTPTGSQLLTVNPSALLFNQIDAGSIENNSSRAKAGLDPSGASGYFGLRVPDGRTLALVGGEIKADGGGIVAFGGRIDLGAVAGTGTVGLNLDGNNLSLNFPNDIPRADVSLTNEAGFIVAAGGGGDIAITAKNINILGRSGLYAGILSNLGTEGAQAGDVTLNATDSVTLANSIIGNDVSSGAIGNAGNININATKAVTVEGRTEEGYSLLGSDVFSGAVGNAGNVNIETGGLRVISSQVGASNFGKGNAGNLTVRASNSVELSGELPLNSRTNENGEPIGSPGGLFAQVDLTGEGQGGNLTIETRHLSVSDGSKVQVASFGQGNAGSILIRASQVEVFNTSRYSDYITGIFATIASNDPLTVSPPKGESGNITIEAEQLSLRDGGNVSVSTEGEGNAGNLLVQASDLVEVLGKDPEPEDGSSFLGANVTQEAIGRGGDVTIKTRQLSVTDKAQVSVSSQGSGKAGSLEVTAPFIRLDNGTITAATASGEGGNIILEGQDFRLRHNSAISATAEGGSGSGGNIRIDTDTLVALEDSDITANAFGGPGGRVQINTQGLFRSLDSDITASSEQGIDGVVEINTPDVELQASLTQLSANFISPEQVVAGSCLARRNGEQGSFVVTGTGGLPHSPYEAISGRYNVTGVQSIQGSGPVSQSAEVVESTAWKKGDPIREAQGMVVTADGRTIVGTNPQLVSLAKAQNLVCHSD